MSTTWVGDGWASSTLHDAVVKYESATTNNIGDFTKFTFPLIRPKTAEQLRLFSSYWYDDPQGGLSNQQRSQAFDRSEDTLLAAALAYQRESLLP
jgi:hypothetical protein